jgi:transposase-like protein
MSNSNSTRNGHAAKGRRFTPKQKQQALELARAKVLPRTAIAQLIGATLQSLRRWEEAAKQTAPCEPPPAPVPAIEAAAQAIESAKPVPKAARPRSPYAPHDPAQGLGEHEVAAILELKREHPSMGPAQIRAQLKRFKGWRVSNKAGAPGWPSST